MCKILVLLFGSFCILMIQNATGKERNFVTEGTPDLVCLGFGEIGCRIACKVITELYDIPTLSVCNLNEKCICRTEENSVKSLWNKNFQQSQLSTHLLSYIEKNPKLYRGTRKILREFPRTPQDHIEELKKEFPKIRKFQDLQPAEVTYPLDYFASRSDVQLIDDAFHQIELEPSEKLEEIDFFQQIEKFIEDDFKNNEEFKQVIHKQLCQIDHESIKKILEKHFPDKTCDNNDSVDIKPYDKLTDEIGILMVKEFINPVPNSMW